MSDTSPHDQASMLWNAKLAPWRQPRQGELLFEFRKGDDRYACELRDHSQFSASALWREFDDVESLSGWPR